eukprot:1179455-Prorocentrum_minimum.AAC.5
MPQHILLGDAHKNILNGYMTLKGVLVFATLVKGRAHDAKTALSSLRKSRSEAELREELHRYAKSSSCTWGELCAHPQAVTLVCEHPVGVYGTLTWMCESHTASSFPPSTTTRIVE